MEGFVAYLLMALVIAALCLVYWLKNRPVNAAADRFALLFLEARRYALDDADLLPENEPAGEDTVRLLPMELQDPRLQAVFARGADARMSGYDAQMEQALRALFDVLGKNQHLKRHYFDYYNALFTLHRLFLQVCAQPQAPLSRDEWKDLERYLNDRARITSLALQRMSAKGRRALSGQTREPSQPQRKEGIG